jgi:dienelactone hydrolase
MSFEKRLFAAYQALPVPGSRFRILFWHAWWGLTEFFINAYDRLAAEGFYVLARDVLNSQTAEAIEGEKNCAQVDRSAAKGDVRACLDYLTAREDIWQ